MTDTFRLATPEEIKELNELFGGHVKLEPQAPDWIMAYIAWAEKVMDDTSLPDVFHAGYAAGRASRG
jgi:hypothetical protein